MRRTFRSSVLLAISMVFIAAPAWPQQKTALKIMPLGDSITFGSPDPSYGGYRHLLGTLLTNDGYRVEFVGSRGDSEGHPGWTIAQIQG